MKSGMFAELQREPWAMEPAALEAFMLKIAAIEMTEAAVAAHAATLGDVAEKSRMEVKGGVASIPISGVLVKKKPWYYSFFGIDATTYDQVQADLAAALADEGVKSIRLMVDSPGGQVAGVKEASDAIAAARALKPVSAQIEDMGASGAYWLASQASKVTASLNALVGSIGVYSTYVDSSKAAENEGYKVHVVASGSHKGMGVAGAPITEEQLAAMKAVIDGMAANFVQDVVRGRGRSADLVGKWADGRVWIASEAVQKGLIDGISKSQSRSDVPAAASSKSLQTEVSMSDTNPGAAAENKAAVDKAGVDARAAERQRLQDLKAAFPKDQAFAFEQYEKGASVQDAKVAYCAVLEGRQAALQAENESLKKAGATRAAGAPPIPQAGGAGEELAGGEDAFIAAARQYRDEQAAAGRKMNLFQAMSATIRKHPELYKAHLERADALKGQIAQRKRVEGIK